MKKTRPTVDEGTEIDVVNPCDELWTEMFSLLFEVRDDDWPTQPRRLREISRLALQLVDVIEGVEG